MRRTRARRSSRRAPSCARAGLLPGADRVALALALILAATGAAAHGFSPALLELRERSDGSVAVEWRASPSTAPEANLEPLLPARCRPLSEPLAGATAEAVSRSWSVDCGPDGLVGAAIGVRDLDVARTDALVRVALRDGRQIHAVLRAGEPAFVVPARPSRAATFGSYLALGVHHLLAGPDHLLFLLALLLIVDGMRSLVAATTAFTLGHSLTLALAALGLARVPQGPVEVLVAGSVLTLATELVRGGDDARPSLLRRRPALAAAGFGLLHGLGFAGALRESGLPEGQVPLALLGFNVGIEIAQLAVIGAATAAWALLRRVGSGTGRGSRLLVRITAEAIGAVSGWWLVERGLALLRRA